MNEILKKLSNNLKKLMGLLSLFLFQACPEPLDLPDMEMKVINYSNKHIVYFSDLGYYNQVDTVFWNGKDILSDVNKNTLSPFDTILDPYYKETLRKRLSEGKLYYYFIDRKIVDSLSWQQISDEYLVLKRVDISSIEQLDEMDWTICYP